MSDCIFCKIAAGEIPSATIYEDDDFRVILERACADPSQETFCRCDGDQRRDGGEGASAGRKDRHGDEEVAGMCRFQSGSEQRDCGWSDGVPFSCACDSEI